MKKSFISLLILLNILLSTAVGFYQIPVKASVVYNNPAQSVIPSTTGLLFYDGFEDGTLNKWNDTMQNHASGYDDFGVVSSADSYSGSNSLYHSNAWHQTDSIDIKGLSDYNEVWISAWIKVIGTIDNFVGVGFYHFDPIFHFWYDFDSYADENEFDVWCGSPVGNGTTVTKNMPNENQWYLHQFKITKNSMELYINGTLVASHTQDLSTMFTQDIHYIALWTNKECYIDDVSVYGRWYSDFENGFDGWYEDDGLFINPPERVGTSTDYYYSATHSMKTNSTTYANMVHNWAFQEYNVWMTNYIFISDSSYNSYDFYINGIMNSNDDGLTLIRLKGDLHDDYLRCYYWKNGGTVYLGESPRLTYNEWHRIDSHVFVDSVNGTVAFYLDGTRIFYVDSLNNLRVGDEYPTYIYTDQNDQQIVYYDDVSVYLNNDDYVPPIVIGDISCTITPSDVDGDTHYDFVTNVTSTLNLDYGYLEMKMNVNFGDFYENQVDIIEPSGKTWIVHDLEPMDYGSGYFGKLILIAETSLDKIESGESLQIYFNMKTPNPNPSGSYNFPIEVKERTDGWGEVIGDDIVTVDVTYNPSLMVDLNPSSVYRNDPYDFTLYFQNTFDITKSVLITLPSSFTITNWVSYDGSFTDTDIEILTPSNRAYFNCSGVFAGDYITFTTTQTASVGSVIVNVECRDDYSGTGAIIIEADKTLTVKSLNTLGTLTNLQDDFPDNYVTVSGYWESSGFDEYPIYVNNMVTDYWGSIRCNPISPFNFAYTIYAFNSPMSSYNITFDVSMYNEDWYPYSLITLVDDYSSINAQIILGDVNKITNWRYDAPSTKYSYDPVIDIGWNNTEGTFIRPPDLTPLRINLIGTTDSITVYVNGVETISNSVVNNASVTPTRIILGDIYSYKSYGSPTSGVGSGNVFFDNINVEASSIDFLNVTINDRTYDANNSGYEWLFKGDVYKLIAYYKGATNIDLTFNDTVHTVIFRYNNNTAKGEVLVSGADGTWKNENVAIGLSSSTTAYNNNILKTEWKFSLSDNIVDVFNTPLNYELSDGVNNVTGTTTVTFNLYNLGGLAEYDFGGDGYIVEGGSALQDSAKESPSYAESWMIYRRLQYFHTLAEWDMNNKEYIESFAPQVGIGEIEFGFDYKLLDKENQAWIEGLKAVITVETIQVGDLGINPDKALITYYVDWWNNGVYIRRDKLTSYHYGYATWVGDAPSSSIGGQYPTNRTSVPFWIDLWFDKQNAGKTIGGRINSQYFGEYEDGVSWWFGYNGFRPSVTNVTASMVFADLKDENGAIVSSQEISLVRIRCIVRKTSSGTEYSGTDGDDDRYRMLSYQHTNLQVSGDRMSGIDTPTFVETKEIKLQGYGVFDPVSTILSSLAGIITSALFGLGKLAISSIDTILSWVGLPYGTFSGFVNMVTLIFGQLIATLGSVVSMISTMLTLITMFFTTILNFVTYIVGIIVFFGVDIFSVPIQVIGLFMAVLNGTSINFYGFLLDFTPYASLMVALKILIVPLASIYLLAWIFWGNIDMNGEPDMVEALGRILKLFEIFRDIYTNVFWIFNRIRNELISVYNFLRSHIPFLGGGSGGNTDEH